MEPEPPGAAFFAWNQSRPNLVGAGVCSVTIDFRPGAAQKSGGSATLGEKGALPAFVWLNC